MSRKQYSDTEREFIFQWADRWRHLVTLIYDFLRTDDTSRLPTLPGELDQISYQNFRSWFLDNEMVFLPLWKDFYMSQDWTLDTSNDLIVEIRNAEKVLENPFFCWYGPEGLVVFFRAYVIDSKSGQVNEKQAWTTAMTLLRLDAIAAEFVLWISDGGGDNEGNSNEYG